MRHTAWKCILLIVHCLTFASIRESKNVNALQASLLASPTLPTFSSVPSVPIVIGTEWNETMVLLAKARPVPIVIGTGRSGITVARQPVIYTRFLINSSDNIGRNLQRLMMVHQTKNGSYSKDIAF